MDILSHLFRWLPGDEGVDGDADEVRLLADCLMYTTTISFVPSNLATTGSGMNVASSPSFSIIVSDMDGVSLTMRLLGMKVIMAQLLNAMASSGYTFTFPT